MEYLIEGKAVDILESEIRIYCLVTQDVYTKDNDKLYPFPFQLYIDQNLKVHNEEDPSADLSGFRFFDENGEPIILNSEHFICDGMQGFIYNNRIYICDLLEQP